MVRFHGTKSAKMCSGSAIHSHWSHRMAPAQIDRASQEMLTREYWIQEAKKSNRKQITVYTAVFWQNWILSLATFQEKQVQMRCWLFLEKRPFVGHWGLLCHQESVGGLAQVTRLAGSLTVKDSWDWNAADWSLSWGPVDVSQGLSKCTHECNQKLLSISHYKVR